MTREDWSNRRKWDKLLLGRWFYDKH
jgi:hypothetical protein